jgi:hypothetical protein
VPEPGNLGLWPDLLSEFQSKFQPGFENFWLELEYIWKKNNDYDGSTL